MPTQHELSLTTKANILWKALKEEFKLAGPIFIVGLGGSMLLSAFFSMAWILVAAVTVVGVSWSGSAIADKYQKKIEEHSKRDAKIK